MKLNKRAVALLISLALLATAVVGTTVAFIFASSGPVNNTFTPARVDCAVTVSNDGYSVTNTGDTAAYIRVAVLVNWKTADGQFYAQAPTFEVKTGGDWIKGADGYYYYIKSLAPASETTNGDPVPAESTTSLTITVTPSELAGYELSIEVVASAIQTTADAVAEWSNAVQVDGEVLARK